MVRKIDWDEPLSDADKAWLRDRDRHDEIASNEARFAKPKTENSGSGEGEQQQDPEDDYDSWKVQELKEEAATRTPPVDLTGLSKKEQLIEALRAWDREHPDDEGE